MALLTLFSLVFIWGFAAYVNDDVALWGLLIIVLALVTPISYGLFVWLKTGVWGSIDVFTAYCALEKQCVDIYSVSSYVGFAKLNNWYIGTNVAWTAALVPMLGNIFCGLVLDKSETLEKVRKWMVTCDSYPNEQHLNQSGMQRGQLK